MTLRKENKTWNWKVELSWISNHPYPDSELSCLKKANEAIENNENFKLAYDDMHSNLKFILNNPLNGKYVKHFRIEKDITGILSAYCEEDDFWPIFTQLTLYK